MIRSDKAGIYQLLRALDLRAQDEIRQRILEAPLAKKQPIPDISSNNTCIYICTEDRNHYLMRCSTCLVNGACLRIGCVPVFWVMSLRRSAAAGCDHLPQMVVRQPVMVEKGIIGLKHSIQLLDAESLVWIAALGCCHGSSDGRTVARYALGIPASCFDQDGASE